MSVGHGPGAPNPGSSRESGEPRGDRASWSSVDQNGRHDQFGSCRLRDGSAMLRPAGFAGVAVRKSQESSSCFLELGNSETRSGFGRGSGAREKWRSGRGTDGELGPSEPEVREPQEEILQRYYIESTGVDWGSSAGIAEAGRSCLTAARFDSSRCEAFPMRRPPALPRRSPCCARARGRGSA